MIFLFFGPIIYIVVMIIGTIVSAGSKHYEAPVDLSLKNGEEYKDAQHSTPEYPDIADQLDTRLTNVFRNPWKGIL